MFPLHLLQFVNNPLLGTAGVKLRHTAASSGHLIRDNHRPVSPGFITQTAGTISQASHSHYTVQYTTGTVQYSTGLALTLHVTHTDSAKTQAVSNIERSNQEDSTGEIYLPSAKLLHKPNNNFTHKKILNS